MGVVVAAELTRAMGGLVTFPVHLATTDSTEMVEAESFEEPRDFPCTSTAAWRRLSWWFCHPCSWRDSTLRLFFTQKPLLRTMNNVRVATEARAGNGPSLVDSVV